MKRDKKAILLSLMTTLSLMGCTPKVIEKIDENRETIVYDAFDIIKERTNSDPNEVFMKALENIKPALEVKARRVGGANYQVPMEVSHDRAQSLALRWLNTAAKNRGGKSMAEKLANELIDASNNTGGAVKKREDTHRMAEANKAFAHYRW